MAHRLRDRRRAEERLEALADEAPDPEEACRAAIAILRPVVGFDRWCWPRTDPGSALSTAGIAEFDLWAEVPRIAALQEHGDVSGKRALVLGGRASASLSATAGGDLARSRRWRECLEPYGVGDELMTVCCDRHGCWGSVEMMRDSSDRPFDEDDVDLLAGFAPTLARLLRRSARRGWGSPSSRPGALAPATLILGESLEAVSWTASFKDWLAELSPHGLLPPAVYELGVRARVPAELPATVRIRTQTGRWATFEAAQLEGESNGDVAITIREASTAEVFDLLCMAHDLTRRERQLVALVLDGLSTKQLAAALSISAYTVQDHLKAVFAKTGLRSRRELSSHLAGR